MKYLYVFLLVVIFAVTSCMGGAAVESEDISALANEKKTEKRGIYGFGHGIGGYYGSGHIGGFGHYGHGYGHSIAYPSYPYAFHGPISGHTYYPYIGGYHHGFH